MLAEPEAVAEALARYGRPAIFNTDWSCLDFVDTRIRRLT
jgi:hypothetical protein